LLHARVVALGSAAADSKEPADKIDLARVHIESAIASETILGDDDRAVMHAEAALRAYPSSAAAHGFLRRKKHSRGALPAMLGHLEQEILEATTDAHKLELLAEKARLLDALGGRGAEGRTTWEQVLSHAPNHTAAVAGLEAELVARAIAGGSAADWEALALHLGRMAESYATETRLAAWLHVERAQVLEQKMGRVDAARGALERALELDRGVGPVRNVLVRHAAAHGDWGGLVRLLDDEAGIESSPSRAARLELDGAAVAAFRVGNETWACALLERAAARAPTFPSVDRRVLEELIRLHEREGRWVDAARARRARLRFVTDPAAIAYELRTLAAVAEQHGDTETAIADVQRALSVDATDPTLVEMLDRLLTAAGKHDERIATWLQEAVRTDDAGRRSHGLLRAAKICEELGRSDEALQHLRSAWVVAPGDPDVLDALARALAPKPADSIETGPRSLVELYAQAADEASDSGRKVAYLEKVALLWEEVLGDASRATRAYERILAIEGDRRSAILGLERTAARMGDARTLARALLEEARLSSDSGAQLALRTRAAVALAKHDPSRAAQLVRDVLSRDPEHAAARQLETQLEEAAGRWELAAKSMRARIERAGTTQEKVALWLAVAQIEHTRLHQPAESLAALEKARALDPAHPVPPEEIAKALEARGDARALRDMVEKLAAQAKTPDERAQHLLRAAEIDELRLNDDAAAMRNYQRALAETPDDDLIADRLGRVMVRCAQKSRGRELPQLAALLARQIENAASPAAARGKSFELAALLSEIGQEASRATTLLESLLAEEPGHIPALRTLESLRRRGGEAAALARVLAREADELKDVRARLGAFWSLAALEEWKLPVGDPAATYRHILELDPNDLGALEATLRHELANVRSGDAQARRNALNALRAMLPFASDDDSRLALHLTLALMLEASAKDSPDAAAGDAPAREALDRYRDALRIDPHSVTASAGVARLAGKLGEVEPALAAAMSLADLAADARLRGRYLVEAADLLLGPSTDERLGPRSERRTRATTILERALDADPDSTAAAAKLAAVTLEDHQGERLVSAFRSALARAKSPDAVIMLGTELARVARDDLKDLTIGIDAMRLVRAAVPQHVPSLLTLSELCIAQRTWPEAVGALEAVVTVGREPSQKLLALFALASIYEKVLTRPAEVERVLRQALTIEPKNGRALRALLRRIAAEPAKSDAAAERARRTEIAHLLERVAEVETDAEQKAAILLELSDVQTNLGDARSAEKALVEAVATAPSNARAFVRLGSLFRRPDGADPVGYARALNTVIGLGQQTGRVDARWLAALGQLEIHSLSRLREGIAHLQQAVSLDPTLYETRFELAGALAGAKANGDAARVLLGMIAPTAHPLLSIADPAMALELLERTLATERRPDEALVAGELRAVTGQVDEARIAWLRSRRPAPGDTPAVLERPTLVAHVLPAESRHVLVDVAGAMSGIETKMLRSDLGDLSVSQRDRIAPRSGHPLRTLVDRLARAMGVPEVELAVSPKEARTRVVVQDEPWIVIPAALTKQAEARVVANLARAMARIAFGVPWLEELPAPHALALLVAGARHVLPNYAEDDLDSATARLVAQYAPSVSRSLSRRQRKALEELAPRMASPQGRPPPAPDLVSGLLRGELRAAFVVCGDLLLLLDEIASSDPEMQKAVGAPGPRALAAVLQHPYAGDVARFALTPEATALRRRLGSTWTG
jgi:tetratricopeptide (TPR) repeat protein